MIDQTVFDTSEVLYQLGVRQVVICPGSRNAPLVVSFTRHPKLETFSVVDERSAGFIVMGMALQSGRPTAVCCTSGSALLNFAPAAAEAFYQEIPVIFISADRPPEWIDQRDGQTIKQWGALEPHVKKSYQLPVDRSHSDAQWEYRCKLQESVIVSEQSPKGPVHLNIPFREPFYPDADQDLTFTAPRQTWQIVKGKVEAEPQLLAPFLQAWAGASKRIIILGQGQPSSPVLDLLSQLSTDRSTPILSDIIGNGHEVAEVITGQDLLLLQNRKNSLKPDLVVTLGQSLLSKQLKLFLREGVDHWHLSQGERISDIFQNLRGVVEAPLEGVLGHLVSLDGGDKGYWNSWRSAQRATEEVLEETLAAQSYTDYTAVHQIMSQLPAGSIVHLANSMSVRYANFFQYKVPPDIRFYANRGTSGIDGANSTAVGYALNSDKTNILISGDLSFLYDRNAFLHEHCVPNLKMVVINNGGGGIFDLIPGPRRLHDEERTKYLMTSHERSLDSFAQQEGFQYFEARTSEELSASIEPWLATKGTSLLEIRTSKQSNQQVYDLVKKTLSEREG